MSTNLEDIGSLQTEGRYGPSSNIDLVSTIEMCNIIHVADKAISPAVSACLPKIAEVIDKISARLLEGGRVIYVGAGTSGRLGVLDASELPPTFSAPYSQFIALIAGGDAAIRRASEGSEDSISAVIEDLGRINPPLNSTDSLIGIASSGRTPYVLNGLSHARDLGLLTVGISCASPSRIRDVCDHVIECVVGPEVITGSTRMKAGTATKLILNMISTGVMIRIGKTYGNMMVDLKLTNHKLVDRSRRTFRAILPFSTLSDVDIDDLTSRCGGSLKLALVVARLGCSVEQATLALKGVGGVIRKIWEPDIATWPQLGRPRPLVLCVDAGGTKCTAVIADAGGVVCRADAGPSNFVTLGHDAAMISIASAISTALAQLIPEPQSNAPLPHTEPMFSGAWVGGAGLDRLADLNTVKPRLAQLLGLGDLSRLHVTNDASLLSATITTAATERTRRTGVVLILGTGSLAYSFWYDPGTRTIPTRIDRTSGWGYLLGDEGSAFYIGRKALRAALRHRDLGLPPTSLHLAIKEHYGCESVGDIISRIYQPLVNSSRPEGAPVLQEDPKLRIADLCPVVFRLAYPPSEGVERDQEAHGILRVAAAKAVDLIKPLISRGDVSAADSVLVMGGALPQVERFAGVIVEELKNQGHVFAEIKVAGDATEDAIKYLQKMYLLPPERIHFGKTTYYNRRF